MYYALLQGAEIYSVRTAGTEFLQRQIEKVSGFPSPLPEDANDTLAWMEKNNQETNRAFQQYLAKRKAGGQRLYFSNRAHALYFLKNVAPTKLVDGAWLYGILKRSHEYRFRSLVRTYLEELGDGSPSHNHVLLYKQLLDRTGTDDFSGLDDEHYLQGALQLALGHLAEQHLPEVIGYNLGYEQLPLHLLITVYELRELGVDSYYFQLHVTIDNASTGHASKAVHAMLDNLPVVSDRAEYLRRVANGYLLNDLGLSSTAVIAAFNLENELINMLLGKRLAAEGVHSDRCRIGGKTVNEWLAQGDIAGFLRALIEKGWIRRGEDPSLSRFWQLVDGDRAAMFGVFSHYERQLLHDWIADGWIGGSKHRHSIPAGSSPCAPCDTNSNSAFDADIAALESALGSMTHSEKTAYLLPLLSPSKHHTPVGLHATRIFSHLVF